MDALKIAFDTLIVGALALPWVYLAVLLFLPGSENRIGDLLSQIKQPSVQAITGVLLFAVTYTLGSAVERVAQDSFNDDDLHVWNFRMATTEDRIIAGVYCGTDYNHLLQAAGNHTLSDKIKAFHCLNCSDSDSTCPPSGASAASNIPEVTSASPPRPGCPCQSILSPKGTDTSDKLEEQERPLISTARDIFGLQGNALLVRGEDPTLRLRQLHDQIVVLRGATFNGLLALAFCVFAWGVSAQREKPHSTLCWIEVMVLALVPPFILHLAWSAWSRHYRETYVTGPPYMEFSLFVVGGAGALLLWIIPLLRWALPSLRGRTVTKPGNWPRWAWPASGILFTVLSLAGIFGWWATEVLYTQQVVYSYDSQPPAEAKTN